MKICSSIQMLHSPVKLLSFFSKFESFSTLLYFGLAPTPVDGLENGTCEDPCVVEEGAGGSRGIEIPDILKTNGYTGYYHMTSLLFIGQCCGMNSI